MNNQITVGTKKLYKCYTCGQPIIFGNGKKDRRNLDGSVHVCNVSDEEKRQRARNASKNKYNKWFWGYGPGAQYRRYGYYTKEEYKQRREEAYDRANEWRKQYANKELSLEKAGEILELAHEVILQICRLRRHEYPKELIQTIKAAYRRLALIHHPDKNNNSKESNEKFRTISEAYQKLIP